MASSGGQMTDQMGSQGGMKFTSGDWGQYLQEMTKEDSQVMHLLLNASKMLQPTFSSNTTLCSLLVGSPGPDSMEFISVPCELQLPVSGIMCMEVMANSMVRRDAIYGLQHVLHLEKNSQLNLLRPHNFNLRRVHSHLDDEIVKKSFGMVFDMESIQDEYYNNSIETLKQTLKWTWHEKNYKECPSRGLCSMFGNSKSQPPI